MSLSIFEFDSTPVRIAGTPEAPLFVAADVCRVLGIVNARDAVAALDDDLKGVANADTLGGAQQMTVVTEAGLYFLVFKSRKPQAKAFCRWVTGTVLPQIRRTGSFGAAPEQMEVEDLSPALQGYVAVVRIFVGMGARVDLAAGAVGKVWPKLVAAAGCQVGLGWEAKEQKFVELELQLETLSGVGSAEFKAADLAVRFSWEGGAYDLSRTLAAYARKNPQGRVEEVRKNHGRFWRIHFPAAAEAGNTLG